MSRAIVVIGISLLCTTQLLAEHTVDANVLRSVDSSLVTITQALDEIDPSAISIDYREGKMIEEYVAICRNHIASARQIRRSVDSSGGLAAATQLAFRLKDLDANLSELASLVATPFTVTRSYDRKKGMAWANELLQIRKTLSRVLFDVEESILKALKNADARLERCSPVPNAQ
jgi:hypothetical protein